MFLDGRQLRKRHLHPQIPPGHHNALTQGADFVDVVHAGLVLDFGDDVNISAAVFFQEVFQIHNVLFPGHKGGCHIVHLVLNAKEQIGLVLLAEIFLPENLSREAHALAVAEDAANHHAAMDVLRLQGFHLKDN